MKPLDIFFVVFWPLVVIWLWRQCRASGHITTTAWAFIGSTSIWWLEAPWNWVLYVRYNPEYYALMPADLPVLGVADGLPWVTLLVYGLWFTIPTYFAAKWAVGRGWSLRSIFIGAMIFGAVDEGVLEIVLLVSNDVYAYTNVIPGFAYNEGSAHQYPLDVPLWMAPIMGLYTVTIARSLRGEGGGENATADSLTGRLAALRSFGGSVDGMAVNLFWCVAVAHFLYILAMLPATYIRFEHWRTTVGIAAPFGHVPWPW